MSSALHDGFDVVDVEHANDADVLCILVPDDVIPLLQLAPGDRSCVIVASGYTLAFGRLSPPGDAGMVAPRMLGPEVRRCYEEGVGFISAVGVERDATGTARERVLAVALAIGGLRQGAIQLSAHDEAVLDLGVEQVLSPALTAVNNAFVQTMLEHGVPLEAIVVELVLSGEVERTYRLLREIGYAAQSELHSPTSQYGQLSRRGRYDHLDLLQHHACARRGHRQRAVRRRVGRGTGRRVPGPDRAEGPARGSRGPLVRDRAADAARAGGDRGLLSDDRVEPGSCGRPRSPQGSARRPGRPRSEEFAMETPAFEGVIGDDWRTSTPWWPDEARPPRRARPT